MAEPSRTETGALEALLAERSRLIVPLCSFYVLYSGLDWIVYPDQASRWLVYRLVVFGVAALPHRFIPWLRSRGMLALVYFYFFVATFGINVMIFESGGFDSSYYVGLMVILGLLGMIFPMSARRMLPALALALVPFLTLCILRGESSAPRIAEACTHLLATGFFVLIGSHLGARLFLSHHQAQKEMAHLVHELEDCSRRDPLTGVFNRRYLEERLHEELARFARHASPFCVILADLDHFKEVNDRHGHGAGDEALRGVARALASTTRVENILCRYGGEEFALLLPETPLDGAVRAAELLRGSVELLDVTYQGVSIDVSISIGVAEARSGDDGETIVRRADEALYQAKAQGRNCVVAAGV